MPSFEHYRQLAAASLVAYGMMTVSAAATAEAVDELMGQGQTMPVELTLYLASAGLAMIGGGARIARNVVTGEDYAEE